MVVISEKLQKALQELFEQVGAGKEVIENTPYRYALALLEMLDGYNKFVDLKTFEVPHGGVVVYEVCEFYSLCEHHMLPFFGKVHIGYISKKKCFGLSKLARLVDKFAKRLQIQERMTQEIADALWNELQDTSGAISPDVTGEEIRDAGVYVIVEGHHLCMKMRGVQKQDAVTITEAYRGCFDMGDDAHRRREEFKMILRTKMRDLSKVKRSAELLREMKNQKIARKMTKSAEQREED